MQDTDKKVMYKKVKGTRGTVAEFSIRCGLQHDHGLELVTHKVDEAVRIVETYLRQCAGSGRPYLTGSVTASTAVYAWTEVGGIGVSSHEPEIIYSGQRNPMFKSMTDEQVSEFLFGLGSVLGKAFAQLKVHLAYKDYRWSLQREESVSPEEEAV